MDILGVKMKPAKKQSRKTQKGIKVVYIATPMKVETSASKFRALVQELTGKDSDSARFIDIHDHHHDHPVQRVDLEEHGSIAVPTSSASTNSNYSYESSSPAGSESIFDSFDKYMPPMDGSFMSMFQPDFLCDSSDQLDFFN